MPSHRRATAVASPDRPCSLRHRVAGAGRLGRWFARLLAWLLFCVPLAAWAAPEPVSSTHIGVPLGAFIEVLEDPDGRLTLEDVRGRGDQMRPSGREVPNFGYTRAVYWFHLRLRNDDGQVVRRFLEAQYPMLDDAHFFALRGNDVVDSMRAGRLFPFSVRDIDHRNLIFPVELRAGETVDVWVRVKTDSSMQLPLMQFDPDGLRERDQSRNLLLGAYYGVMAAMLLFNLFAYLQVRDRSYLHYVQYLAAYIAFQFFLNGLGFEFVLPELPRVARSALPVCICLALIGMINFSRSFLDLRANLPQADRLLRGYSIFLAVALPFSAFAPYAGAIQVATVNALLVSVITFVISAMSVYRGLKQARYFMLAWATPLLGLALYPLKTFGLLPTNFITEYGLQLGSALEALLLSVALVDRVKVLKEQNERIQAEATRELEQRVRQRTVELNDALRGLSDANAVLHTLNALDGLTGIKNRQHFDQRLAAELKALARTPAPLALLLIDIDHFKAVNDHHGHLAGDACLRAVAQAVSASMLRPHDEAARYGGEEFAVIAPQTTLAGAMGLAERVRLAIAALDVDVDGVRIPLTASLGVAVTTVDGGADALISAADVALYAAKRDGRNTVRAAAEAD